MSKVTVRDVRLNTRDYRNWPLIKFDNKADECFHEWERHLWDIDEAYCPKCGSFATLVTEAKP